MRLIDWLKKNLLSRPMDAEEKKAEAKASKLRALLNVQRAVEMIESKDCTPDQLDAATVWGEEITLNLRKDTDKLKERRA